MEYEHHPVEFRHYPAINDKGEKAELTIATGPVIIERGRVLLDKHGEDRFWKFPGGRYIDSFDFPDNTRREAREELGLEIRVIGKPFVYQFKRNHEGIPEYVILVHYLAKRIIIERIRPERDVKKYNWFDVNDLPDNCAPNIAPAVRHFKKILKGK